MDSISFQRQILKLDLEESHQQWKVTSNVRKEKRKKKVVEVFERS